MAYDHTICALRPKGNKKWISSFLLCEAFNYDTNIIIFSCPYDTNFDYISDYKINVCYFSIKPLAMDDSSYGICLEKQLVFGSTIIYIQKEDLIFFTNCMSMVDPSLRLFEAMPDVDILIIHLVISST